MKGTLTAWTTTGGHKDDVRGVKREVSVNSAGNLAENWRAQWVEVDGRIGKRSFSVHKFGEKEARAMAIEARRENLALVLKERQRLLLTNVVGAGPMDLPIVGADRRPSRFERGTNSARRPGVFVIEGCPFERASEEGFQPLQVLLPLPAFLNAVPQFEGHWTTRARHPRERARARIAGAPSPVRR